MNLKMGRKCLMVILYALVWTYPIESKRNALVFDAKFFERKVYIGTNKLVTALDGDFIPILKQVDTKVVVYPEKFDLIDVNYNGNITVMEKSGKNSTITGIQITFLKLLETDYKIVLSVASEYMMMDRILSSLY